MSVRETILQTVEGSPGREFIIDSDIHPEPYSPQSFRERLPARWREHCETYGDPQRGPYAALTGYPRYIPRTSRRDAWPSNGGLPGSDLELMREQHLDRHGVALGVLEPLGQGSWTRNLELMGAVCSALNEWQLEDFVAHEPRLKASIVVPMEDAPAAVAEIRKHADNRDFVQVQMNSLSEEPFGRRKYWPIYEEAVSHGLPVGIHVGGSTGARTGGGWPSYYNEEHYSLVNSTQAHLTSLVLEGVFEHFPALKVILIEGGIAWTPALSTRLDRLWSRLGSEVPHCRKPPSEYVKANVFFSTQPMEEPENPEDLLQIFADIGWNNILYASDYPHWDYDDPEYAFKAPLSVEQKRKIMFDNALSVYRLD
ncbi:amidohydrolase family protein [bacterium]|nr:amidohydrolase family protein [bacterium]